MLLPKNTNPAFSTYYYGAIVLKAFIDTQATEVDFLELFQLSNLIVKTSIKSFALALDWLYLIGAVGFSKDSKIILLKNNADVSEVA